MTSPCVHHWNCSRPVKGIVREVCEKCGGERDMPAWDWVEGIDTTIRYPVREEKEMVANQVGTDKQHLMERSRVLEGLKPRILEAWDQQKPNIGATVDALRAQGIEILETTLRRKLQKWGVQTRWSGRVALTYEQKMERSHELDTWKSQILETWERHKPNLADAKNDLKTQGLKITGSTLRGKLHKWGVVLHPEREGAGIRPEQSSEVERPRGNLIKTLTHLINERDTYLLQLKAKVKRIEDDLETLHQTMQILERTDADLDQVTDLADNE